MKKKFSWIKLLALALSYVLVAAAASAVTWSMAGPTKLTELSALIQEKFIGEADLTAVEDAAAAAMIDSLGDRWSYYIPAADMAAHNEQKNNEYVGIGATVSLREDGQGLDVVRLEPGGPAVSAGILPGDIICQVDGQQVSTLGITGARELIRGEAGTAVSVTVIRNGEELTFRVERQSILVDVATGSMLTDKVGYIRIANFDKRCAQETIEAIEQLMEQGAQALIFDVRFNPGGYKYELVDLLDYLLPEGPLFRSLSYTGQEYVDQSDANCLEMPMAVLVNESSFSAAEFFAAALSEYEWASVVGVPTVGKGHYQNTYTLSDGSGVGLSIGKYSTPDGVCLEGVGITPDVVVEVDEKTAADIYAQILDPGDDPQVQAALEILQ